MMISMVSELRTARSAFTRITHAAVLSAGNMSIRLFQAVEGVSFIRPAPSGRSHPVLVVP
jgi:hypothetical protein